MGDACGGNPSAEAKFDIGTRNARALLIVRSINVLPIDQFEREWQWVRIEPAFHQGWRFGQIVVGQIDIPKSPLPRRLIEELRQDLASIAG